MSSLVRLVDRVFDFGVVAFAAWTLCAHLAVALGWGLDRLEVLALAASLLGVSVAAGVRFLGGSRSEHAGPDAPSSATSSPGTAAPGAAAPGPGVGERVVVAVGAACAGIALALDLPVSIGWSLAAATVGFACVRELRQPEDLSTTSPTPAGPLATALLVGLALVCLGLVLTAHRPDADDSFYLNLAVAAVDTPEASLLAGDSLHRVPDVPLALPVYRVHSLELLQATIARWTGRPVLDVAHLWLPALAALLLPFVYARRTRWLTPRAWPVATALAIGVLVFGAAASHGWASFGLLRLHQGKGLLLSLALPAVLGYALEFARNGGRRAWTLLAASQIAAVGLSASGLWLGPAVAGIALIAALPELRTTASWRRLAEGAASSAYVLAVALWLRADTARAFQEAAVPSPELALSSAELASQALQAVMASGIAGGLTVFVALGAWSFARTKVARRVCAFGAAAALALWNPFAADWIAAHLTSAPTYWRVLWVLPLPALVGIVLGSPLERPDRPTTLRRGVTVGLISLIAFGSLLALDPRSFALAGANHVRVGAPGWKVPENEFDAARAIVEAASRDERVLAPRRVAPWIATFSDYPAALVVRVEYLPVLARPLGEEELQRRMRLMRFVSGQKSSPGGLALLRAAIQSDDLRVVCVSQSAILRSRQLPALLVDTGFQKIHQNADYQVWKRVPSRGETR